VKPFNFLSAFQETSCSDLSFIGEIEPATAQQRKGTKQTLRPIAPYNRNPVEAAKTCFDRETAQPISTKRLKTYAQTLSTYHLRPQSNSRTPISMIAGQRVGGKAVEWNRAGSVGGIPSGCV
jgi:hypothetical protein